MGHIGKEARNGLDLGGFVRCMKRIECQPRDSLSLFLEISMILHLLNVLTWGMAVD